MKQLLVIFLLAFLLTLTQQKLYKSEKYKYIDTYNKVQQKLVRIYYGD